MQEIAVQVVKCDFSPLAMIIAALLLMIGSGFLVSFISCFFLLHGYRLPPELPLIGIIHDGHRPWPSCPFVLPPPPHFLLTSATAR